MNLPMLAFGFNGYEGDKIVLSIDEVIGYPESTCFEGGYSVVGTVEIQVGCYHVVSESYHFATGALYRFAEELERCYETLEGTATFEMEYDGTLLIDVKMTSGRRADIVGSFKERADVGNRLDFEIATDQSCFRSVLQEIERVKSIFGGYEGVKSEKGTGLWNRFRKNKA